MKKMFRVMTAFTVVLMIAASFEQMGTGEGN